MGLTDLERSVCDAIAAGRDDLVKLASALIAYDTTAREVGDPPRQEAALQEHLAQRLRDGGAVIDLFEPEAGELAGAPLVPEGLDFAGRPQLIATFPGAGGGQSLLLNGHIDVVSGEPRAEWTSDPFTPEVRDGKLFGRGACDMKGGVAAMTSAAEAIARAGITLAGDLIVATNTDEESSGAGGTALVRRGLRADAGIVTEPTSFRTWVACRGSEYGVIRVPGRPGHAEVRQPDWRHGGAVNAIEKAGVVLDAIASLRARWAADDRFRHPVLSAPSLLPTVVSGGEWPVTYPSSCDLTIAVMYLSVQADGEGWGSLVREEVQEWV
ncbi:MAG: M20 family metallopeptidase, partial [Solirubrobacteraceae bacterium]